MKRFSKSALVALALVVSTLASAAPDKKKSAKEGKFIREKFINREATLKSRDQKNLDFDAANIIGGTKGPYGSMVAKSSADKNYDFVKIRLRWHPEMVQSASNMDYSE